MCGLSHKGGTEWAWIGCWLTYHTPALVSTGISVGVRWVELIPQCRAHRRTHHIWWANTHTTHHACGQHLLWHTVEEAHPSGHKGVCARFVCAHTIILIHATCPNAGITWALACSPLPAHQISVHWHTMLAHHSHHTGAHGVNSGACATPL